MSSISLALGAGGARGIGHIMVLEAVDELGLKVEACAGTSIGAVIGAIYGSGFSGRDIREHVLEVAGRRSNLLKRLLGSQALNIVGLGRAGGALVNSRELLEEFLPAGVPQTFEGLRMPMQAIATDLRNDGAVAFGSGQLLPAVAASIAIPGLMRPVRFGGRTLIDGGLVDPVPVRYIEKGRAPLVAVDLASEPLGLRQIERSGGAFGTAMEAVHILGRQVTAMRLAERPPSVVLRPSLGHYRSLDFHKLLEILREFAPFKADAKRRIAAALEVKAAA